MTKQQIYQYTGNEKQLYGVRRFISAEGSTNGCTLLHVHTAGGLELDILPDTGLDIGQVRYKGVNISYMSKNGYDAPASFMPYEDEFSHSFPGGMLYTCGLRSVGPSHRDGPEWHPLHGRFHGQSAEQVSADVRGENIIISGKLQESALFGHLFQLSRTITIPAWGSQIIVEDTVENLTPNKQEFMLLYHFNFGYPMLSGDTRLHLPGLASSKARTADMEKFIADAFFFSAPRDNFPEQVFFHSCAQGEATVENEKLKMAVTLRWDTAALPILAQWKSMASGDYVLGLEPSNCYIMGRAFERENKTIKSLGAFESVTTKNELIFEIR